MAWLASDGWRKVAESGSISLVKVTLYNIVTGEEVHLWARDYDRWYATECEAPEWYDVAIDEDARRAWNRSRGRISVGDRAMVIKGRKIEAGYAGVVEKIKKIRDRYGRHVADYVVFEDGTATNIENCVLIMD